VSVFTVPPEKKGKGYFALNNRIKITALITINTKIINGNLSGKLVYLL
jgi:hypothetical protein